MNSPCHIGSKKGPTDRAAWWNMRPATSAPTLPSSMLDK